MPPLQNKHEFHIGPLMAEDSEYYVVRPVRLYTGRPRGHDKKRKVGKRQTKRKVWRR